MKRGQGKGGRAIQAALLILALALVTACDKAQLMAPTDSTVSLTASTVVLSSSGSTVLTAFVTEPSGTPVQNGTTVRFTTSLGRLESAEAQTKNGLATTTLFADGASGVATVKAVSGGAASDALTITLGSAAVDTVTVRAAPSSVPASGGTVTVTALVTGENNRPLSGVPVLFTSNNGTLSAATATTDSSGAASVTLTTNRETTVTASVGSKSGTATVTVATTASVTLSATGAAAGAPSSVTVTPASGTAPSVSLNWGDGNTTDLGLVPAARTATHVYSSPGTYTITATATDNGLTATTSTTVVVTVRPSVAISASQSSGATSVTFVFTVTPATANGVRNVQVSFGDNTDPVDLGAITAATIVTHRFGSANTYTVTATQTDANGNTTTAVVVVTVTS